MSTPPGSSSSAVAAVPSGAHAGTDWDALPAVTTNEELERYGTPEPATRDKVRARLEPIDREFLAAAPLVFVATATPDGRCDVSPKGDPAGFVQVLDDCTLAIPERAGNKRMDGFHNILANPHVGLNFVIPGRGDTLRVNGSARIVTDGPFFDDMIVKGHRPVLALLVRVQEVFYHCPKAFMRSSTWRPESWHPGRVRRYADIAKILWRAGDPAEDVDRHYGAGYAAGLYPGNIPAENPPTS